MDMKRTILTMLGLALFATAYPQGCIPFRNLVGFGQFAKPDYDPVTGQQTKWFLTVTQRYYNSHQTYSGKEFVPENDWQEKTTKLYMINFGATRVLSKGWAISIDLPLSSGSRTAWRPEHNTSDTSARTTHSFGIGDLRITGYKWLWDISQPTRGNIQLGVGIKFPSGDYRYTDYFYLNDTTQVLAPVNTTIQLGDGGTGITAELNSFYALNSTVTLYGNLFYLFNPRDVNGVSTTYGRAPTPQQQKATADVYSVPDSYTVRVGANLVVHEFTLWAGVRMEGSPVRDARLAVLWRTSRRAGFCTPSCRHCSTC